MTKIHLRLVRQRIEENGDSSINRLRVASNLSLWFLDEHEFSANSKFERRGAGGAS